jgi:lysozyme
MKVSETGIDLIKRFEGLELESYQDIAGVWTIGYGHTETAGPNQKISEREAEALLRRDLEPRERAVSQLVGVSLNQNEFDALVSLVYNIGVNGFKNSTARRRLNRNDRMGAAEAITWWNKATVNGVLREVRGLTRRRAAERALFLTPVIPPIVNNPDDVRENSRVTPIEESSRRESLGDSRTVQGAVIAGGAGAAASNIGRESAEELDQLETNIEQGTGLTEQSTSDGGLGAGAVENPGTDGAPTEGTGAAPGGDGAAPSGDGSTPPVDGTGSPAAGGDGGEAGAPAGESLTDETPAEGVGTDGAAPGTAPDAAAPSGDAPADGPAVESSPDGGGAAPTEGATAPGTVESVEVSGLRPSKHERHAVDAQLQLALLIIIVLSALYIIFARVDDWWKYRR